jgi:hypothetical protein
MGTKVECFFCRVKQPRNHLEEVCFEAIRGGEAVLTCDSCMNVPGLVERFNYGANGQFMLMLNTKLDQLLRKK